MKRSIVILSFAFLLIPIALAIALWPRLGPRVWSLLDRVIEGPEDRFINGRSFKK
jgi:hypothetical protein